MAGKRADNGSYSLSVSKPLGGFGGAPEVADAVAGDKTGWRTGAESAKGK